MNCLPMADRFKPNLGLALTTRIVAATIALAAVSPIAGASIITLSDVSSDSTDPANLGATLNFIVSGGNTLTLSVTNNTTTPNDFDISQVYFNSTADITSLSLTSPLDNDDLNAPTGWEFFTPGPPGNPTQADGFGDFDYAVKLFGDINLNPNVVSAGEQEDLTFSFSCAGGATCDMNDFVDLNASGYLAAAFFQNGPDLNPGGEVPDPDSAFGAAVPVPAAVWLFGSGLLGLVGIARRRRS